MTCACFVDNFAIQNAAITTMLDLVALTQSVLQESESKVDQGAPGEGGVGGMAGEGLTATGEERKRSSSEGTVSVVILPALSPKHLQLLNTSTTFYKVRGEGHKV